jgi:glycosyltransferase involved in cell wall biosynthesis
MNASGSDPLNVLQIGMHERGAGGGVDRVFWQLHDHLSPDADLKLSAFFFRHRTDPVVDRLGEFCLGSTEQPVHRRLWKVRRGVLQELKAHSSSVLVASHFALYASALLPNLSQMNHVVHFHGPWAAETAVEGNWHVNIAFKRLVERAVYSSAKAFVTLSQAFKNRLTVDYQVDPGRVHVIPGGVDLNQFSPGERDEARSRLGWPKSALIILCVRRLVHRMGIKDLVDAFAALAREYPDAMLMIGGTGPLREELEDIVRSHRLTGRVKFVGFIPNSDLASAYRAADVSVVPSQSLEGFGLAAIESVACGVPALVTPVDGLPETVGRLDPNLVLPDKSSAAIAERLDKFLSGKLSFPSSERCRKYVEANFSWPMIAQRVKALYWQVRNAGDPGQ